MSLPHAGISLRKLIKIAQKYLCQIRSINGSGLSIISHHMIKVRQVFASQGRNKDAPLSLVKFVAKVIQAMNNKKGG